MNTKTALVILALMVVSVIGLILTDNPFESYINNFYSLSEDNQNNLKNAKLKLLKSSKNLDTCGFELVRFENEVAKTIEFTILTEGNQGIDTTSIKYRDALVLRVKEHFSIHHEALRRACE